MNEVVDDTFLKDFSNKTMVSVPDPQPTKIKKAAAAKKVTISEASESDIVIETLLNQKQKEMQKPTKSVGKKEKKENVESEPAYGNEANQLRKKITEYSLLFPDITKSFIATINKKKNPSVEDLTKYVEELDIICSVGTGMDGFIMDAIFSVIENVESVTQNYRYSIVGLAKNLKENELFMNLAKRVYIKYSSFVDAPIEVQLMISVVLTAYITIQENIENKKSNK